MDSQTFFGQLFSDLFQPNKMVKSEHLKARIFDKCRANTLGSDHTCVGVLFDGEQVHTLCACTCHDSLRFDIQIKKTASGFVVYEREYETVHLQPATGI
jgi:hypothetical protein